MVMNGSSFAARDSAISSGLGRWLSFFGLGTIPVYLGLHYSRPGPSQATRCPRTSVRQASSAPAHASRTAFILTSSLTILQLSNCDSLTRTLSSSGPFRADRGPVITALDAGGVGNLRYSILQA